MKLTRGADFRMIPVLLGLFILSFAVAFVFCRDQARHYRQLAAKAERTAIVVVSEEDIPLRNHPQGTLSSYEGWASYYQVVSDDTLLIIAFLFVALVLSWRFARPARTS